VVHSVSQILTMLWLVSAGRGVAFVPASATLLRIPHVAFIPLATHVPLPVELHLLWPRHARNPAVAQVLATLEDLHPREHPSGPVISPHAGEKADTEAASHNT
jgi:DNA-binding transcriptional LysR family regulator